jgi:Ca-activated chloride channel family protein
MTKQQMGLHLKVEKNLIARESATRRVIEIKLRAPKLMTARDERMPLNLALVIDRSGSMGGDKIDYVRRAAGHVIGLLNEKDRAAVYIYDNVVECIMHSAPMTEDNRHHCVSAINEVTARGMTNLSDGWLAGCEAVAQHLSAETINRVLLLSDGLANQGITSTTQLGQHAAEINQRGIATSTFGVGFDFNEHLLERISNQGGGNFYYIEQPGQIQEIFLQELEELLNVSVKEVTVSLPLVNGTISYEVLGGWKHTIIDDALQIHIGALAEGQERSLYLVATLPATQNDQEISLPIVLHALDENAQPFEQKQEITLRYASLAECEAAPFDKELMEHFGRVYLSDTTREALILERKGHHREASQLMQDAILMNRPYMSTEELRQFERRNEQIKDGLTEMKRKRMHYNTFRDSRTRGYDKAMDEEE